MALRSAGLIGRDQEGGRRPPAGRELVRHGLVGGAFVREISEKSSVCDGTRYFSTKVHLRSNEYMRRPS